MQKYNYYLFLLRDEHELRPAEGSGWVVEHMLCKQNTSGLI